ncbi:MAG TPA: (2Fe-2S)-binding protein [Stellaceae bacterium]|nr:(2Fe-2S)-binding protein [Stellaceae bacterium]
MPRLSRDMRHPIRLVVNGREMAGDAAPRLLLSDFLRHVLGLTGTHVGCEHGVCGACTVLIDGVPTRSCLVFAVQAAGRKVDTVEGLAGPDGELSPLQLAFQRNHALQCGYCTPGILMSLSAYLRTHPEPDEGALRDMLSGHLCRCTGYTPIIRAALEAARELRKES